MGKQISPTARTTQTQMRTSHHMVPTPHCTQMTKRHSLKRLWMTGQHKTRRPMAADSPGQSSNPGHHDDEEEESLMEQASEIAETAEEKAEEAVHQLAAAGNAAAEFVEESIGLDAAQEDQEAQNDA